MNKYYFGSFGLVRGYGPLYRTIDEADRSVAEDGRDQRRNGGSSDRNAVAVCSVTGLCWWVDEEDSPEAERLPVRLPTGEQARYSRMEIVAYQSLWGDLTELAGFS